MTEEPLEGTYAFSEFVGVNTADSLAEKAEEVLRGCASDIDEDPGCLGREMEKREKKFPSAFALQHGGTHYRDFEIQPAEFITRNRLTFNQGNVVKYICRFKQKHGKLDLKKVIHYVQMELEVEYGIKSKVEYSDD